MCQRYFSGGCLTAPPPSSCAASLCFVLAPSWKRCPLAPSCVHTLVPPCLLAQGSSVCSLARRSCLCLPPARPSLWRRPFHLCGYVFVGVATSYFGPLCYGLCDAFAFHSGPFYFASWGYASPNAWCCAARGIKMKSHGIRHRAICLDAPSLRQMRQTRA